MSNSSNTLGRLIKQPSSILTNPFFRHLGLPPAFETLTVRPGTQADFLGHLPPGIGELFKYAPGWFQFGPWPYVAYGLPGTVSMDDNPFRQGGGDGATLTGIACSLWGPADINILNVGGVTPSTAIPFNNGGAGSGGLYPGGLVQRVRRGRQLLGKRVRITGSYRYQTPDGGAVRGGMSVWLRGRVNQMDADTLYSSGSTGEVANDGNTEFVDLNAAFVGDGIVAGDTLYVEGQWDNDVAALPHSLVKGWRQPTRVYEVDDVVDGTHLLVRPAGGTGTGMLKSGSDFSWAVSRANRGECSELGNRGITMRDDNHKVGHVIRWTEIPTVGDNYHQGEEWLCRGFDWLAAPWGHDGVLGAADVSSRVLMFDWPGSPHLVVGQSNNPLSIPKDNYPADTLSKAYLQGPNAPAGSRLWYLDQDDWADDPTLGNSLLIENTVVPADTSVQFFEEIVTVPSNLALDKEDLFLILLPCAPGDVASLASSIVVVWYALNIELLPEEGGGIEDRMQYDYLSQDPESWFQGAQEQRHYYQYPIYYPVNYPLSTNFTPGTLFNGDTNVPAALFSTTQNVVDIASDGQPWTGAQTVTLEGDGVGLARQHRLPPGSCVTKAILYVRSSDNLSNPAAVWLFMNHHKPPRAALQTEVGETNAAVGVIEIPDNLGGPGGWTIFDFTVWRNRIGLWWPVDSAMSWSPEERSHQGASELFLSARVGNLALGGAVSHIELASAGHMTVLVDPRLAISHWRSD